MSTFERLRDAIRPIEAEYRDDYQAIARDAVEECAGDESELSDRIWEAVDGSSWVTYTFPAQFVALISENDSYYADNFGADGMVEDGAINWSRVAFGAMYADALDYAIGIALPEWRMTRPGACQECGHLEDEHADPADGDTVCLADGDGVRFCPCESYQAADNA